MPSFEKADREVIRMAEELISQFHKQLSEAAVRITYMIAWPCLDESGSPMEDAITKGGMKCLGLTRKNATRHRKEGLADATITLDGPYWDLAETEQRRSLLDHELQHIAVVPDGQNDKGEAVYKRDNAGRPIIKLRKHDLEIGWFKACAVRHGVYSQERMQANQLMADNGQYFWPDIIAIVSARGSRTQKLELASAE